MTNEVRVEADWERAPNLLDGAQEMTMSAEQADLAYWLSAVAQGTLRGRAERGHAATTPDYMSQPGPLREALVLELGNRSIAEARAGRVLSHYIAAAPAGPALGLFATPLA